MKLKIAIVGPSEAGKTSVTNLLGNENIADSSSSSSSGGPTVRVPYYPTGSVRIVEFTTRINELRKYNLDVDVQLWEIGGNSRLKSIWPGVQKDCDGVVIIYSTSEDSHIKDASALHMHFVTHSNSGISPSQCFIIGNNFRGMRDLGPQKIIGVHPKTRHIALNVEDDTNYLREEFKNFISTVAQIAHERQKSNI